MSDPKLDLLTPDNCQLIVIDHQPQMAFGVQSIDRQALKNNVVALAKAAKVHRPATTIFLRAWAASCSRTSRPTLPFEQQLNSALHARAEPSRRDLGH